MLFFTRGKFFAEFLLLRNKYVFFDFCYLLDDIISAAENEQ